MKKRALSLGVVLVCIVVAAAVVADVLAILGRPLTPWFAWMLP